MRYLPHFVIFLTTLMSLAHADERMLISLNRVDDQSKAIGTIQVEEANCGILLTPNLHGLPPGVHGFHLHQNPSCDDHGNAAGGHYDPIESGKHEGPYSGAGHLGDLPVLIVDAEGRATLPILVPRLTMESLKGHALIIHVGSDNYSDLPQKLGGGGKRIACGVINP